MCFTFGLNSNIHSSIIPAPCNISKLDAVFAIDMSTDSQSQHKAEKDMLKQLTKAISQSGQYNDVALVSYASKANVAFPFQKKFNYDDFAANVDSLQG